jgi:hypothetical protein
MKKNILINFILFVAILLFAFLMYRCSITGSDVVRTQHDPGGGYFFYSYGSRIWLNPSFRQGSMSGRVRSGGPRAGK